MDIGLVNQCQHPTMRSTGTDIYLNFDRVELCHVYIQEAMYPSGGEPMRVRCHIFHIVPKYNVLSDAEETCRRS